MWEQKKSRLPLWSGKGLEPIRSQVLVDADYVFGRQLLGESRTRIRDFICSLQQVFFPATVSLFTTSEQMAKKWNARGDIHTHVCKAKVEALDAKLKDLVKAEHCHISLFAPPRFMHRLAGRLQTLEDAFWSVSLVSNWTPAEAYGLPKRWLSTFPPPTIRLWGGLAYYALPVSAQGLPAYNIACSACWRYLAQSVSECGQFYLCSSCLMTLRS